MNSFFRHANGTELKPTIVGWGTARKLHHCQNRSERNKFELPFISLRLFLLDIGKGK
jgi:hypothetical protein